MPKSKVFKFKTTCKRNKAEGQDGTMQDGSPHLTILPRASPPDPLSSCEAQRELVDNFLAGFYGKDIICNVQYCSMCAWVNSVNGISLDRCPVCGQPVKHISLIIEREVLASFKDAVVEITLGK